MKDLDPTVFHRQLGIVDPEKLYALKVARLGVGAVGSVVAVTLGKMGVGSLELWDPDIVETPNIPNQFYFKRHIGKPKVEALAEFLTEDIGAFEVITKHEAFKPGVSQLSSPDIVICAVDSMAFRKDFWEKSVKNRFKPGLLIETRMGAEEFRIYSVPPLNSKYHWAYEQQLYTEGEADETPCTEKAIFYNVQWMGGFIGSLVKDFIVDEEYSIPFEIMGNILNNMLVTNIEPPVEHDQPDQIPA